MLKACCCLHRPRLMFSCVHSHCWAFVSLRFQAFSSTSKNEYAAKAFVNKDVGVVFKITVSSGTDIGAYSHIPTEDEVLLSPNARFAVARELYTDEDGYACVDLTETHGDILSS